MQNTVVIPGMFLGLLFNDSLPSITFGEVVSEITGSQLTTSSRLIGSRTLDLKLTGTSFITEYYSQSGLEVVIIPMHSIVWMLRIEMEFITRKLREMASQSEC